MWETRRRPRARPQREVRTRRIVLACLSYSTGVPKSGGGCGPPGQLVAGEPHDVLDRVGDDGAGSAQAVDLARRRPRVAADDCARMSHSFTWGRRGLRD